MKLREKFSMLDAVVFFAISHIPKSCDLQNDKFTFKEIDADEKILS
jgi:hypothetical protein